MPAESARLRRRLGRRDRRFLGIVLAAVTLTAPVGVVLADRGAKPPPGCVRTLERGFMGGQTVTKCRGSAPGVLNRKTALTDPPPPFTLGSSMLARTAARKLIVPQSVAHVAPR